MMDKESLEQFKTIYKKSFGEDLPDDIALEKATKLLNLVRAVYKPMTQGEYDALQKRRKETEEN